MNDLKQRILWYAIKYQGDWTKIGNAIQRKEAYKKIDSFPYPFVTMADKEYPKIFLRLRFPPWILFYKGNLKLLEKEMVGIVGARICTLQALQNTEFVVKQLRSKYTIVSGLAKGIDGMAHRSAMDESTIGIIGCGIDRIYPKENEQLYYEMEKKQLILSEYPPGVPPLKHHFPWRNRLIAACSKYLIVIQAKKRSGTMLTVNECVELSIPVYCLPSSFNEEQYDGCNYLIENGAYLLTKEELAKL
ncbi:MAG: DNA-processing protein DprA [Firmicutes bacterium]|nr:DNA-processing protein DprA [Bacillota bacterium]